MYKSILYTTTIQIKSAFLIPCRVKDIPTNISLSNKFSLSNKCLSNKCVSNKVSFEQMFFEQVSGTHQEYLLTVTSAPGLIVPTPVP